ncbi:MAG: aminotransferase class V-fold PLP-dependent enzyme [Hyphomicrobiaceae bacterium]
MRWPQGCASPKIAQRANRDELKINVVPSNRSDALDLDVLESMLGHDVGIIAITWVPTNGGLVNPAQEVGRIVRKYGVSYLLDACQALGQMPIDVGALGGSFRSATGRTFMRGLRGTGILFVAAKWPDVLEPMMIDRPFCCAVDGAQSIYIVQ